MKLVKTSHIFSDIQDRDAILINNVLHLTKRNELLFKGTVYTNLIKKNEVGTITPFELCFKNIQMFDCVNIEISNLDTKMSSNFMLLEDSNYILENKLHGFSHYIFSTYTYVYQIVAQSYSSSL